MRLGRIEGRETWLTYCMNVHPGGTLDATLEAIRSTVLPLRDRLGVRGPFGVGLRFDGATVQQLDEDKASRERLRRDLDEHDLVPFTANGFVVGAFHGAALKEQVYEPTWADRGRVAYTQRFARVLASLVPEGTEVSLSSAPGSWRATVRPGETEVDRARGVAEAARGLARIADETGVFVRLGLEPEPGCTVDTTEGAIRFLRGPVAEALRGRDAAGEHVGVCFDVCHQAVMHEDVEESLRRLDAEGVRIVKLQASSALEVADLGDPAAQRALARFQEPVYLHQAAAPDGEGGVHFVEDLPHLLANADTLASRGPWRVHFHVPVFRERVLTALGTTRAELERALAFIATTGAVRHVEIETYTWDVLPPAERAAGSGFDLVEGLANEYRFVLASLATHGVVALDAGSTEGV